MEKLIVIGIDGASPDLMSPLMDHGKLPNFQRIRQTGVWGRLRSVPNQRSAAAWSSFVTGLNPGRHGVFEFYERVPGSYDIRFTRAGSRDGMSFWRYLSDQGKTSIVINVPMTYPAEEIKGCMLSGLDAPGKNSRNFGYPPHLLSELERSIGSYIQEPGVTTLVIAGRRREALEKIMESIRQRGEATRYLMDRYDWDTLVVVFRETDPAHHCFWQDLEESGSEMEHAIEQVYEKIDGELGKILNSAGKACRVLVMSDHGFGFRQHGSGCLNQWLHEAGFLKFIQKDGKTLISSWLKGVYQMLEKALSRRMKERLFGLFPDLINRVQSRVFFAAIDWEKTKAYSDNVMPVIWINSRDFNPAGLVTKEQYGSIVSDLKSTLMEKCLEAVTGRPVVEWVKHREEIYAGPHTSKAPDLLIQWKGSERIAGLRYDKEGRSLFPRYPTREFTVISGDHRPEGIFMATGEGIRGPLEVHGLQIVDVPATAIHLNGLPVPAYMEGRVPEEIFEASFLAANPVRVEEQGINVDKAELSEYSQKEESDLRDRLRGLGYLE